MPATYNKFDSYVEYAATAKIDWDSDTFKVMLTDTQPLVTNTIKANITEIAAGNGYTAGGGTTTITTSSLNGTLTVQGTEVVFTATGGAIAQFQWAVLYDDSVATPVKPLIAWFEYPTKVNLQNGEILRVKFNNTTPGTIFTGS